MAGSCGALFDSSPGAGPNSVMNIEIVYYVRAPGGETGRIVQAFPFRYFCRFELEHLLARAGFRVAGLYGNFDRSPFTDESPEMIFVAERMP